MLGDLIDELDDGLDEGWRDYRERAARKKVQKSARRGEVLKKAAWVVADGKGRVGKWLERKVTAAQEKHGAKHASLEKKHAKAMVKAAQKGTVGAAMDRAKELANKATGLASKADSFLRKNKMVFGHWQKVDKKAGEPDTRKGPVGKRGKIRGKRKAKKSWWRRILSP